MFKEDKKKLILDHFCHLFFQFDLYADRLIRGSTYTRIDLYANRLIRGSTYTRIDLYASIYGS